MTSKEIQQKENDLFAKWANHRQGFVYDGPVVLSEYLSSSPRVLLVLKEVNDTTTSGGWDLRNVLRTESKSATWNNVVRWLRGIRRLNEDLAWTDVDKVGQSDRDSELRSLCVINLKKSPGGATADIDVIRSVAAQDARFLSEQFHLYNPDIVICGGIAGTFRKAVFPDGVGSEWSYTSRGVRYFTTPGGSYVIDYYHPQSRYQASMLYYTLIDALRELQEST